MIRLPIAIHNLPNIGYGHARLINLVIEELPDGISWRTEHIPLGTASDQEFEILQSLLPLTHIRTELIDIASVIHHAIDAFEELGYVVVSHSHSDGEVSVNGRRNSPF